MSADAEKPFDPTPARLAKARREGNVARAGELSANAAFAGGIAGTIVAVAHIGGAMRTAIVPSPNAASFLVLAWALLPAALATAGAIAGGIVQSGGVLLVAPAWKSERLNPVEGCKRIASRETLAHAARAAAAFACTTLAIVPAISVAVQSALGSPGIPGVAAAAWHACVQAALAALAVGTAFAIAEYASARASWLRKLRMSFDERRREIKEEEGDPFARGRRRGLHRSLVRGAIADVKRASFVVANPTHVAVALEYRPPEVAVPRVLVRAAGDAVARVRRLAAQHGIPIVENVPLARALFASSRVGDAIAHEHYIAVAEIVAALSGRS